MKSIIRKLLWGMFEIKLFKRVFWAFYKEYELHNATVFEVALRKRYGKALRVGPFKGLIYPEMEHKGYLGLTPKYLGTFESELFESIETACTMGYQTVLNIGSADGYYSVGFATRLREADVIAWEMLPEMRAVTSAVAKANDSWDRFDLRNICTVQELKSLQLNGRTLIFSDCEGAEDDLLSPEVLSGIESYDIIVECHEMFSPGVTERLLKRFEGSHKIKRIEATQRTLDDIDPGLVSLVPLSKHEILRTYEEPRLYHMHWLHITKK